MKLTDKTNPDLPFYNPRSPKKPLHGYFTDEFTIYADPDYEEACRRAIRDLEERQRRRAEDE